MKQGCCPLFCASAGAPVMEQDKASRPGANDKPTSCLHAWLVSQWLDVSSHPGQKDLQLGFPGRPKRRAAAVSCWGRVFGRHKTSPNGYWGCRGRNSTIGGPPPVPWIQEPKWLGPSLGRDGGRGPGVGGMGGGGAAYGTHAVDGRHTYKSNSSDTVNAIVSLLLPSPVPDITPVPKHLAAASLNNSISHPR